MLKKHKTTCSIVSLIACLGMVGTNAIASSVNGNKAMEVAQKQASKIEAFKLQPRYNVWGFTGDITVTEGQVAVPLMGDNNKVLYAIGEGNYTKNNDGWTAGLGLGYRKIVGDKILGAYLITDYVSTKNNGFVVANPGVEVLGFHDVWDFNVNGYIPLEKQKKLGKEGWAGDDFEDYSFGRAIGHEFYDHKMQEFEEIGAGFDVEVGRTIPWIDNAKIYLGGYHFDSREAESVNGIEARFTYDLNKYTAIELENNYDNVRKNKFIVGLRFSLGGYSQEEKEQFGLSARLLDPIEHDYVVTSSRALVREYLFDKGEQLQHDNIWYFKPGNAIGDVPTGAGTADDPFVNFTPANYAVVEAHKDSGVLDPHPLMYFAKGQYSFNGFKSDRAGSEFDDRFALANGWGMYGRSSDYKARANGDDRAEFLGGLDMFYDSGAGTDTTTLDSVKISNNVAGVANAALYIKNANNVNLNNAYIKNETTSNSYGISVYDSTLNFVAGNNKVEAIGVGGENSSLSVYGIYGISDVVNFSGGNNEIIAEHKTGGSTAGYAIGMQTTNSSLYFIDGINKIKGESSATGSAIVFGLDLRVSNADFINGVNTIESVSAGTATIQGLRAYYGGSTVNFIDGFNTINVTGPLDSTSETGIRINNGSVYFLGGTNVVNLNGYSTSALLSDNSASTGFYFKVAHGVTLNINGRWPHSSAITLSELSSLYMWNGASYEIMPDGDFSQITNFVDFNKNPEDTTNWMLSWSNHGTNLGWT